MVGTLMEGARVVVRVARGDRCNICTYVFIYGPIRETEPAAARPAAEAAPLGYSKNDGGQ